jgi:methionine-rich copper-binding protein CopC
MSGSSCIAVLGRLGGRRELIGGRRPAARAAGAAPWGVRRSLPVLPKLALPLLVLLPLLLLAGPASAHTRLSGAAPAAGSTVEPVAEVVLDFTDEVQPDLSTVAVTGPDGVDRSSGAPVLQDGTRVVQALAGPLAAGRWTVAYRVVARDGHPVVGSHVFDVAAAAPEPSTSAPSDEPSAQLSAQPRTQPSTQSSDQPSSAPGSDTRPLASSGSDGGVPLVLVAVAGLALAGVTGLLLRGRGSPSP